MYYLLLTILVSRTLRKRTAGYCGRTVVKDYAGETFTRSVSKFKLAAGNIEYCVRLVLDSVKSAGIGAA